MTGTTFYSLSQVPEPPAVKTFHHRLVQIQKQNIHLPHLARKIEKLHRTALASSKKKSAKRKPYFVARAYTS